MTMHPHLPMIIDRFTNSDDVTFASASNTFFDFDKTEHAHIRTLFIGAIVRGPMTVRTKGNHVAWIIRAPIGKTANVMCFQIGGAVWAKKWSSCTAVFAAPLCSRENISANYSAPLEGCGNPLRLAGLRFSSCESLRPEVRKISVARHCCSIIGGRHSRQWTKLKNDGSSGLPCCVGRFSEMKAFVDKLVLELNSSRDLSKNQNVPPFLSMISHRTIAADHLHVTGLAFTRVLEHTVRANIVLVSVSFAFLTGDQEDGAGRVGWSDNPALLLTAETFMNILSAVVNLSLFETPGHACNPQFASHPSNHKPELVNRPLTGEIGSSLATANCRRFHGEALEAQA